MALQLNVSEDSATEDLREENNFLRQELFLLCERIQETDNWRDSRSAFKSASRNLEESCKISCADKDDIDSKLSVLETEIVQIRLTNFELLQKIKELEMLRQNAHDDANRMQREIQRLVPHASNCVTLQRLVSQNREKFLRLRIAQQASQCYWERLESSYFQQTAQIFSLQESINDLGVQLKRAKTQRQEELSTIARLKHELPETQFEIEKERLKSQILQQENDRLLSEVNRAQSLCHSQAKELDRLHQNQAQLLNLHNHFKHRDTMNISSLKHSRIEKPQNCQNTNVLSQQGKNKFPQNSPESTHAEKPKYPADQQHCGFLCVPL